MALEVTERSCSLKAVASSTFQLWPTVGRVAVEIQDEGASERGGGTDVNFAVLAISSDFGGVDRATRERAGSSNIECGIRKDLYFEATSWRLPLRGWRFTGQATDADQVGCVGALGKRSFAECRLATRGAYRCRQSCPR